MDWSLVWSSVVEGIKSFFVSGSEDIDHLQSPRFVGAVDGEGRPYGKGKLVSSTKGFVDGLWLAGALIELNICELIYSENGVEHVLHVLKQRSGFLFTCDTENFVARVEIDLSRLPQDEELNFETLTRRLISLVRVQAILEDEIYHTIQQTLDGISKILGPKSGNTATSLTSAEDFLQISLMLKARHNSNAIVKSCLRNEFISQDLKTAIKIFELETENYQRRNQHFLKIQGMPEIRDIQATLTQFLEEALHNHKLALIGELPRNPVDLPAFMTTSFERLEARQLLFMDKSDILVFDETALFNQLPYIKALWSNLVQKVSKSSSATSLDSIKPLTSSVFPFIAKSFIETTKEICERSDLEENELFEVNDQGQLQLRKKIKWRELSSVNVILEQQYQFLHRLLDHFAPGNFSKKRAFDYEMKMVVEVYQTGYKTVRRNKKPWHAKDSMANKKLQITRIHNDTLRIWLCLIDSIFNALLEFFKNKSGKTFSKKLEVRFIDIAGSLIKSFAHFLEKKDDENHEPCRTTASNFIKLARNLTVDQMKSGAGTLEKLVQKISQLIEEQDEESFSNDFANLMAVYSEFWECQKQINCMEAKFAKENAQFQVPMIDVKEGLRKLLDLAMAKQVTVDILKEHLRSFSQFFQQFLRIEFDWVVKKEDFPIEVDDDLVRIADKIQENYVVLKPIEFCKHLEEKSLPIPKHYKFEAIRKLGIIAHQLLTRGDWKDEEILHCTNSLYFAMANSFRHFHLQINYLDFEKFLAESVCPFENIVHQAETPREFIQSIQNVENHVQNSRETIQLIKQELSPVLPSPHHEESTGNNKLVNYLKYKNVIKSDSVYQAMKATDRKFYCHTAFPYEDTPQSIGLSVSISAPNMHARALEILSNHLKPGNRVLDVGSGSGYLTACFARILNGNGPPKRENGLVVGIDRHPHLIFLGMDNMNRDDSSLQSSGQVIFIEGNGWYGASDHGPYHAIHVGAAASEVPMNLLRQLRPGGRMVCPIGPRNGPQYLEQFDKKEDGTVTRVKLIGVRFGPLME